MLAEQRQVRLGLRELGGVVEIHGRALGGEDGDALGVGQQRAERKGRRAQLHQGVKQHDLLAAGVHGEGRSPFAPHSVGGQPAGDPGRLRLQLGVGDAGCLGDQRGALGTALGPLGEPVVELHPP